MSIYNSTKEIPTEINGGVPVNVQDQTTIPIDQLFKKLVSDTNYLTIPANKDEFYITTNLTPPLNTCVCINDGINYYFGIVVDIGLAPTILLDRPLDSSFAAGTTVRHYTANLTVSGNPVSPQIFYVEPADAISQVIDITRLIFKIVANNTCNFNTFGDLSALTHGITIRRVDGVNQNIVNIKQNSDFALSAYDMTILNPTVPAQINGVTARLTFAGQDKHGVAIRLNAGDQLQVVIADDISGLVDFRIMAQGHVVQ